MLRFRKLGILITLFLLLIYSVYTFGGAFNKPFSNTATVIKNYFVAPVSIPLTIQATSTCGYATFTVKPPVKAKTYTLYRVNSGSTEKVAKVFTQSTYQTTFIDNTAVADVSYNYRIAFDKANPSSAVYGPVVTLKSCVITPQLTPPVLQATTDASCGGKIKLSWSGANQSDGFSISRSTLATGTFSILSNFSSSTATFVDTPGQGTFYYKVSTFRNAKTGVTATSSSSVVVSAKSSAVCQTPLTANISVPSSASVGQPVTWSVAATGGTGSYTYSWMGSEGLSGKGNSITRTYTTAGTKIGNLSVTNGSLNIIKSATIIIKPQDVSLPTPVLQATTATSCGGKVQLSWNGTNQSDGFNLYRGTSALGSFSLLSNFSSSTSSYSDTPGQGTFYYKISTFRNAKTGVTATSSSSVVVSAKSSAVCQTPLTANISVPSSASVGQPVTWSVAATGGTGSYTYSWSGMDGLSGNTASVTNTYQSEGTKTGTVKVTSGQDVVTLSANTSIEQAPEPEDGEEINSYVWPTISMFNYTDVVVAPDGVDWKLHNSETLIFMQGNIYKDDKFSIAGLPRNDPRSVCQLVADYYDIPYTTEGQGNERIYLLGNRNHTFSDSYLPDDHGNLTGFKICATSNSIRDDKNKEGFENIDQVFTPSLAEDSSVGPGTEYPIGFTFAELQKLNLRDGFKATIQPHTLNYSAMQGDGKIIETLKINESFTADIIPYSDNRQVQFASFENGVDSKFKGTLKKEFTSDYTHKTEITTVPTYGTMSFQLNLHDLKKIGALYYPLITLSVCSSLQPVSVDVGCIQSYLEYKETDANKQSLGNAIFLGKNIPLYVYLGGYNSFDPDKQPTTTSIDFNITADSYYGHDGLRNKATGEPYYADYDQRAEDSDVQYEDQANAGTTSNLASVFEAFRYWFKGIKGTIFAFFSSIQNTAAVGGVGSYPPLTFKATNANYTRYGGCQDIKASEIGAGKVLAWNDNDPAIITDYAIYEEPKMGIFRNVPKSTAQNADGSAKSGWHLCPKMLDPKLRGMTYTEGMSVYNGLHKIKAHPAKEVYAREYDSYNELFVAYPLNKSLVRSVKKNGVMQRSRSLLGLDGKENSDSSELQGYYMMVENPENGKKVRAIITDKGPRVSRYNTLDISMGVARVLGLTNEEAGRVNAWLVPGKDPDIMHEYICGTESNLYACEYRDTN